MRARAIRDENAIAASLNAVVAYPPNTILKFVNEVLRQFLGRKSEQVTGKELGRLVTHAQEEERKRIARDLHDDLNQRVAAHAIALSNLKNYMLNPDHEGRATMLDRINKLEQQAVALGDEIRMVAHQLHPPSFDAGGLEGALQVLCTEFSTLSRLHVDLRCEGPTKDLPATVMLCCFRVVQEGLRNVAKHARASEVKITIARSTDRVLLELADDGVGVNGHAKNHESGLGLSSMRERVELLSGVFRIAPQEPRGTVVTAVVPIK
jgi:signal transduction histidine kinase